MKMNERNRNIIDARTQTRPNARETKAQENKKQKKKRKKTNCSYRFEANTSVKMKFYVFLYHWEMVLSTHLFIHFINTRFNSLNASFAVDLQQQWLRCMCVSVRVCVRRGDGDNDDDDDTVVSTAVVRVVIASIDITSSFLTLFLIPSTHSILFLHCKIIASMLFTRVQR